jgi:hypothetical protein
VRFRVREGAFDEEFLERLRTQLKTALGQRFIDLCAASETPDTPALASLEISPGAGENVAISVKVEDELTDKRLARDVDLTSMPEDGRPLLIALAADELLRASWAEIDLRGAPKPARPVPIEVTRAVEREEPVTVAPKRPPQLTIGAAFAAEHFGAGHTQLGADAVANYFPFPRLGAQARAGLRSGLAVSAIDGTVHSTAFVLAGGPAFALLRSSRGGLDVVARAVITDGKFRADAQPGARATAGSSTAVHVGGGFYGWIPVISSLAVFGDFLLGAPIRAVAVRDGDREVTGLSGLLLSISVGLSGAIQ